MTLPRKSSYRSRIAELILPRKFRPRIYPVPGFLALHYCYIPPMLVVGYTYSYYRYDTDFFKVGMVSIVWYGIWGWGTCIYCSGLWDAGMCLLGCLWYLHPSNELQV